MYKKVLAILCILFLFTKCTRKTDMSMSVDEISTLQKKIDTVINDSSLLYLKNIEDVLAKNTSYPDSLRAENNYLKGLYFQKKEMIDSATIYFHTATDYVNDTTNIKYKFKYFEKAWTAYLSKDKYGDCLSISNKYKSLLNEEKHYRLLIWSYYFDETIQIKMKEYQKALQTNLLRIELARKKDTKSLPSSLIAQASLKYYYLNDKKGTYIILNNLLQNKEKLTLDSQRQAHGNYGVYLYLDGKFKKALNHYLLALKTIKEKNQSIEKSNLLAIQYNNIAEVQIDLKQYKIARKYLDSFVHLGINNIKRSTQENFFKYQLRLASLTNNDINTVYKYLDTIYDYQDKNYAEKYNKELIALTNANKKEKDLLKLKQKSEYEAIKLKNRFFILGTISFIILIVAILGFLFYRNKKLAFEKQTLQMQQRLFRSQMNPHFTFNALYAIQNLIKKDPEKSTNYLLKFSRLLRINLDNSLQNYVQLEDELESLKKYMDLQLLRFPDKFTFNIQLNHLEEGDLIFIPPMLMQPFIENSIEHGFLGIEYPGEIIVNLTRQNKFILCSIEDNGTGLVLNQQLIKKSVSTNLISDFIKKTTKSKIKITNKKEYSNNQNGMHIEFLIPYKLTEDD